MVYYEQKIRYCDSILIEISQSVITMRSLIILLIFWFLNPEPGFPARPKKLASVPFEIVGSYVIIKAKINNSSTLNLILDSGVRSTLITELTAEDSISLNYSENIFLKGLGSGTQLRALTSKNNTLKFGKLKLDRQTIYVLEEDIFNLSKHTGTKINGLMGSDFFQGYTVKIDYDNKRITFYESASFTPPKKYTPLPVQIEGQKMFIRIPIVDTSSTSKEVKMLVDTGAELAAWFRAYGEDPVKIPQRSIRGFIGQGLNGEIKGYLGRMPRIQIGKSVLHFPVVTFPDSSSIAEVFTESQRDGTIGSQILCRFNLIFDESNNLIYFKPNSNFRNNSSYNIAGIELIQQDPILRLSEVLYVWEGSPAEKAGVQKGDRILEINGKKGFDVNINEIKSMFEVSSRRSMKLILLRGDKTINVEVDMNSQI